MVAMAEQARAGTTVGKAKLPQSTSGVKMAPPSGTLYTAASPAPPPQATNSRRCAGESFIQRDSRLPEAPPINLGAASRPIDAPMPITTSEVTDVRKLRRIDSCPSPFHSDSSISDFSFFRYRRIKNQATAPTRPAITSVVTRCRSDVRATAVE